MKRSRLFHGSRRRRALGQNFLTNQRAADRIVELFAPAEGETILEVGPGRGVLTTRLLRLGARVVAVEVDPALAEELRMTVPEGERFHLILGDARRVDMEALLASHTGDPRFPRARVLANLPYSVAAPILLRLLLLSSRIEAITVMLQREVVDRICAPPGTRTYGSLSVLCQYFTLPRALMNLSPGSFTPQPRVRSALVALPFREGRELSPRAEARYPAFVRALFHSRRRVLPHSLAPVWPPGAGPVARCLEALEIDPRRRSETLRREECIRLFTVMEEAAGDNTNLPETP